MYGGPHHLGGVYYAALYHIGILAPDNVKAPTVLGLLYLIEYHLSVKSGVCRKLFYGCLQCLFDDVPARPFVARKLKFVQDLCRAEQCDTASRQYTFLLSRLGGLDGVFHPGLLFLHLHLGGGTDV